MESNYSNLILINNTINSDFTNISISEDIKLVDSHITKSNKITLYVLTREFRTSDNLTLYKAYDESKKSKTNLCVIYRFKPVPNSKDENAYYCANAFQFKVEALEDFSTKINISFVDQISDTEWIEFLKTLPIHEIYITRECTPTARKRFENYSLVAKTIEVDDLTVFPITEYITHDELSLFVKHTRSLQFPDLQYRDVNWKDQTHFLSIFISSDRIFITDGNLNHIKYTKNRNLLVHPHNLKDYIENLADNMIGYSNKRVRELVGNPKVSHLSTFLKYGLISIRTAHVLAENTEGKVTKKDIKYFRKKLFFRDYFYRIAYDKPYETFDRSTYAGALPRFICEQDLLDWKINTGVKPEISKEELLDIQKARKIYIRWTKGATEFPIINAGINEMNKTGYMLNRLRMMTASYLTWTHQLWWKYPERYFANNLIDCDWVINCINHHIIADVGFYPSKHMGYNMKNQDLIEIEDRQIYYEKNFK